MLKHLIPVRIKDALKVLAGTAVAVPPEEGQSTKICPVCRQRTEFRPLPYSYLKQLENRGFAHPLFQTETMNFDEYSCSRCGAIDRERLFSLFFDQNWQGRGTILEIAPHAAMTEYLRSLPGAIVRTADLYDPAADDCVDITQMSIYKDAQFDAWICSHVLEHIPDDRAAMKELFRVLKPGGAGLVMVPISLTLQTTLEDPSITAPDERWKYFGQADHVRMYAKTDLIERLRESGFLVDQIKGLSFGSERCAQTGVDPESVLYVVRKPERSVI